MTENKSVELNKFMNACILKDVHKERCALELHSISMTFLINTPDVMQGNNQGHIMTFVGPRHFVFMGPFLH